MIYFYDFFSLQDLGFSLFRKITLKAFSLLQKTFLQLPKKLLTTILRSNLTVLLMLPFLKILTFTFHFLLTLFIFIIFYFLFKN